jgi:hypothetical protein
VNVGNLINSLDTLHQILFGVFFAAHIIFGPSNVSHSRKEVGNSFVVKFFHREGLIIEQGVI